MASDRQSFVTGTGRTGTTLRTMVNGCGVFGAAENHCRKIASSFGSRSLSSACPELCTRTWVWVWNRPPGWCWVPSCSWTWEQGACRNAARSARITTQVD